MVVLSITIHRTVTKCSIHGYGDKAQRIEKRMYI